MVAVDVALDVETEYVPALGEQTLGPATKATEEIDAELNEKFSVAATRIQIAESRREFGGNFAIGGDLFVAELRRGRVTIKRRAGEAVASRGSWMPGFPAHP